EEALKLAQRFEELGFSLLATSGTQKFFTKNGLNVQKVAKLNDSKQKNVLDVIDDGSIQLVINTMDKSRQHVKKDGFLIRREAVEHGIALLTSLDTVDAILKVIESRSFSTMAI
ncbi:MAG TPA: carbamoyl-phosphate synthase large subunit, partial [Candidatus Tetragenococcus pullicola]|nr:carbamoyl-phosphate synthase large subunit [Candidatus Tetragenococcus pullicola]